MRSLITIVAFAGKEIRQVIRQPKLIMALIVGPFVILGLFAAGFQPNPPTLRTVLIVDDTSALAEDVRSLDEQLGDQVDVVDVTHDEAGARARLESGEIDLVVITPDSAAETIRGGEHARVLVLHNRLDPFERAAINVATRQAIDQLNRAILGEIVGAGQQRSEEYDDALPEARQASADLAEALRAGDSLAATEARGRLEESLGRAEEQMTGSAATMDRLSIDPEATPSNRVAEARADLDMIGDDPAAAQDAEQLEAELAALEEEISAFQAVPAEVLVQPFIADTETVAGADVPLTAYYSPAVVVVLIQHVVLTFAALSIVKEQSIGATELFRVGPVRTMEVLVGKFLGYSAVGLVVATLLVGVVVGVFATPMIGSWLWLSAVLALTMAASLGLGFVIAAAAGSDVQAVQYAMLALLFTIFFSGLVVSLSRLADGVRQLAFLAPATAGTVALQDVMFRGAAPGADMMAILGTYTVLATFGAYLWMKRQRVA